MITSVKNNSSYNPLSVSVKKPDLKILNEKYRKLSPVERIKEIYNDFDDILLSSSFGTTAVFQLYLFYKVGVKQPVHFIDTSYHFKETLEETLEEMKAEELPSTQTHQFQHTPSEKPLAKVERELEESMRGEDQEEVSPPGEGSAGPPISSDQVTPNQQAITHGPESMLDLPLFLRAVLRDRAVSASCALDLRA